MTSSAGEWMSSLICCSYTSNMVRSESRKFRTKKVSAWHRSLWRGVYQRKVGEKPAGSATAYRIADLWNSGVSAPIIGTTSLEKLKDILGRISALNITLTLAKSNEKVVFMWSLPMRKSTTLRTRMSLKMFSGPNNGPIYGNVWLLWLKLSMCIVPMLPENTECLS